MMSCPQDSGFSDGLVRCNGLSRAGFEEWVFYPGMLFEALETWWGKGGNRDKPHVGLDLRFYRDSRGSINALAAGARVPVMHDGEVAAIRDDFLGRSVYVQHAIQDSDGRRLYTIYGHTSPCDGVRVGGILEAGEVFATVADPLGRKTSAPAHLHLSVAWVPDSIPVEALDWKTIGDARRFLLLDPLQVASFKHAVLPGRA